MPAGTASQPEPAAAACRAALSYQPRHDIGTASGPSSSSGLGAVLLGCQGAGTIDVDDGFAFTDPDEDVVYVIAALQNLAAMDRPPREIGVVTLADLEGSLADFTEIDADAAGQHVHDAVEFLVMVQLAGRIECRHMALADPKVARLERLATVLAWRNRPLNELVLLDIPDFLESPVLIGAYLSICSHLLNEARERLRFPNEDIWPISIANQTS